MNKTFVLRAGMLATVATCSIAAHAAAKQSVSYLGGNDNSTAYVVDWNTTRHTAHVTSNAGTGDATYTESGTLRTLTFTTPIEAVEYAGLDCNGNPYQQAIDTTQMTFNRTSGTDKRGATDVVEANSSTDIGGCTPGLVTVIGTLSDTPVPTTHLDMTLRPSMADIIPGTQLAGLSDTPFSFVTLGPNIGWFGLVAETGTFGSGNVTLNGTARPTSTVNGWIVVDFGSFQRAYTRIAANASSGVENWFESEWAAGAPTLLARTFIVKPNAAAGFGGVTTAAHVWNSGIFLQSPDPTQFDLYHDLTGLFDTSFTDGSPDQTMPATWAFSGTNLLIARAPVGATYTYHRTWVPVANYGKNHFVFEDEVRTDSSGTTVRFVPRVNFYVDGGKAVKPTLPAAQKTAIARPAAAPHAAAN